MRRAALALFALTAVAAAGCGTSLVQRQVRGATFDLSSKEIGLADEYEGQDPRAGNAQVRCDYWTKRRADADGNHLIGVFSWPPEYFANLRGWTEAKKSEVCEVAKTEADAHAAKVNEQERLDALAAARQEHEARDGRAWAEVRGNDCAAAAREDACDGMKAYLAISPGGHHATEAAAAVQAAEPKLAELRRAREQDATRRASQASKQEETAGFRVSSLRATIDDAPAGSATPGEYLRVAFDLTATRALARGVTPIVRAACQVADKRMVDVDTGLDIHLDELALGDTKEIDASPYAKRALVAAPSQCEIVVMRGIAVDTSGPVVRTFCYVPGQGVKDGACAPN